MNLNDFSKWLQYNRVKNLRGLNTFRNHCIYTYIYVYVGTTVFKIYRNKNHISVLPYVMKSLH